MPIAASEIEQPAEELNLGNLVGDFWALCIADAAPGVQERLKKTSGLYFEAVNIQAKAYNAGIILDLESYIDMRRDASGSKVSFVLIEYALDIDLADCVVEHHVIQELNRWATDFVVWPNVSSDCLSIPSLIDLSVGSLFL
ncbi:Alpha-muurolene synthase [Termitomyces sp. Mi166|nr:Alpha-muurolene synthase [Termitomyces sp. Mi166\